NELGDVEVKCRNPGCPNTWTWKRGAQLAQLSKFGKLKRPSRLCDECFRAEKETADQEVACKVDTCSRTWTWTRDAQLRHRLWVGRQRQKAEKAAAKAERAAEEAAKRAEAAKAEAARAAEAKAAEAEAAEVDDTQAQVADEAPAEAVEVRAEATEATAAKAEVDEPTADEGAAEGDEGAAEGEGDEAPSEGDEEGDAEDDNATQAKAEDVDEAAQPKKRKRRRRRKRGKKGADAVDEAEVAAKPVEIPEGPPSRMCTLCAKKVSQLAPKEVPCKVHGCTRTWIWDRASQLRAWAALGTDDLSVEPTPPRRMCETCREFCRSHPDRKIPCGRPGCENTWTYKTGAQLQAALAGRTQDPLRLCDDCSRGGFINSLELGGEELPEGAERMPCVVSGCEGTWVWFPGQKVGSALDDKGLEVGKMCLSCRQERGFDLDVIPPGIGLENAEGAEATPVAADDAAASEAAPEEAEADVAGAAEQAEADAGDATADAASEASEAETEDGQSS
ncbi:MAG: hypothetical protein KC486_10325, partial [Myxococcales bacterium]|nr:hypothetical protein [Myxococcales bacterium]